MHPSAGAARARIAIDTIPLLGRATGVGRYIQELVEQFAKLSPHHEYLYYYGYFSKRLLTGRPRVQELKDRLMKLPLLGRGLRGVRGTAAKYYPREFDLYFEPNFIPLDIKAKHIVTTVHDFSFQLFPEAHPKDRVRYFAKNFTAKISRSCRIITVSGYVKRQAIELLKIPEHAITPVHLGVNHELFKRYSSERQEMCRRQLGLPHKFLLFVGTREPRKNLRRLLQAYAELPERLQAEFRLVLVGPQGWGESDIPGASKLGNRLLIRPYLEGCQLALTYNLASALVYPSLYEGFGLPPVEAMACGCPAIVSSVSSMPEVCGDAAYYVAPDDVQSIAGGMNIVLTDDNLKRSLIEKGLNRAKLFTWENTARATLEVFDEVLRTAH
jgi:glycosyltransferase involved in cell wall biosynthesis